MALLENRGVRKIGAFEILGDGHKMRWARTPIITLLQAIRPFPTVFSVLKTFSHFRQIWKLSSANPFILELSKICGLVKGYLLSSVLLKMMPTSLLVSISVTDSKVQFLWTYYWQLSQFVVLCWRSIQWPICPITLRSDCWLISVLSGYSLTKKADYQQLLIEKQIGFYYSQKDIWASTIPL